MPETRPNTRYEQHARMMNVAVELFAAHGYAAIGLRELARHLNIHAGSLYYHFQNKQELLFELIESALSDLLNATQLQQKGCVTATQRLQCFMDVFVGFHQSDSPRLQLLVREYLHLSTEQKDEIDQLKARYVALLQGILEPRGASGSPEGELLATLIVGMLFNGWGWQGIALSGEGLSMVLTRLVQGMQASRPLRIPAYA